MLNLFVSRKKCAVTSQVPSGTVFRKLKKGITPVVTLSLLLVVSVVAVLNFSSWFGNFSSTIFVDAESSYDVQTLTNNINIEFYDNGVLYVSHPTESINVSDIIIEGISCSVSGFFSKGVSKFSLGGCVFNSGEGTFDVAVITSVGVFSRSILVSCGGLCGYLNTSVSDLTPGVLDSVSFSVDYLIKGFDEFKGVMWKSSDIGVSSGFARFADLDGSSEKTNLIIGNNGYIDKIIAFNSSGSNIWNKSGSNGMKGGIGVVDYDSDGRDDIVMAGDAFSDLRLINSTGGQVWRHTNVNNVGTVSFFDLNSDGKKEIITGNNSNFLIYNLNGSDFFPFSIPSVGVPYEIDYGDFDSDGVMDHVLFLTYGPGNLILVQAMNFSGSLIWNSSNVLNRNGYSGFALSSFDYDSSGFDNYVVASESGLINIFNSTGGHILNKSNGGVAIPEVLAFDFENTGFNDDLIVSSNSGVYRYNKSLDVVWFFNSPSSVYSVKISDVVGDSRDELLVFDNSGIVFVLDLSDGSEILNINLGLIGPSSAYGDSPSLDLADVNLDGVLDIGVALTAGYGMVLQVIDCEAKFSDGTYQMNWNESSSSYFVSRSFSSVGTYDYNIICSKKGNNDMISSGSILVS